MKNFKDTQVFQIISKRWKNQDMEQYFIDKNKAFIDRLKKEVKK